MRSRRLSGLTERPPSGLASQAADKAAGLVTVKEAAELLGLSPVTLRLQILRGKLKATKRGRDWWLTPREVERYRQEHKR